MNPVSNSEGDGISGEGYDTKDFQDDNHKPSDLSSMEKEISCVGKEEEKDKERGLGLRGYNLPIIREKFGLGLGQVLKITRGRSYKQATLKKVLNRT